MSHKVQLEAAQRKKKIADAVRAWSKTRRVCRCSRPKLAARLDATLSEIRSALRNSRKTVKKKTAKVDMLENAKRYSTATSLHQKFSGVYGVRTVQRARTSARCELAQMKRRVRIEFDETWDKFQCTPHLSQQGPWR